MDIMEWSVNSFHEKAVKEKRLLSKPNEKTDISMYDKEVECTFEKFSMFNYEFDKSRRVKVRPFFQFTYLIGDTKDRIYSKFYVDR